MKVFDYRILQKFAKQTKGLFVDWHKIYSIYVNENDGRLSYIQKNSNVNINI